MRHKQSSKKISTSASVKLFIALALAVFFGWLLAVTNAAPNKPFVSGTANLRFTILHTNDIHSHDESFVERGRMMGGLARIGHLIRQLKREDPSALAIDAGDMFQGTPLFTLYHGEIEVNLLNRIGYDICTIGNHEFDKGPVNLARQLKAADFQIISCNLDLTTVPALKAKVKPYVVRRIKGESVAFIGAITPDLEQLVVNLNGIKVKSAGSDWMNPIREQIEQVTKASINKIVLVTHCGVELDNQLAKALPDVDVIIGGHSHTRLSKPVVVPHEDGTATLIVQAGSYGRNLGKLDIAFDTMGHLVGKETDYRLISITDSIPEETDLKQYISQKALPLLHLKQEIAGFAQREFDNRFYNLPWDSAIGDLICDALQEAGEQYGAQISLENRGGIRGRIERGPITYEKVEEVLPFDNHLVFATISGKCLLKVLEHGLAGTSRGSFLEVHGLKIGYDMARTSGNRIVFALAQNETGRYRPIEYSGQYKIVTNDYTFKTGQGFNFSGAQDIKYSPDRLSVALRSYLLKHKQVKPQAPCRIVPLMDGLLTVKGKAPDKILHVKDTVPGSKLTLVVGQKGGIEPVLSAFPVPLSRPRIIADSAISNSYGEYTWHLSLKDLCMQCNQPAYPSSNDQCSYEQERGLAHKSSELFVCAIVQPPKHSKDRRTLISYPLPTN